MKKSALILTACIFVACSEAQTIAQEAELPRSEAVVSQASLASTDATLGGMSWEMIAKDSHIQFTASQTGTEFTGSFTDFSADINFDSDNIEAASVTVDINMSAFEAGSADRNGALPGKEWFYIKNFPKAQFSSDEFISLGEDKYEARGELSLRGISQPLTLPFTLEINDGRADMVGQVSLNRGDFGVGQGVWATDEWVSLDVKLDVKIAATRRSGP